MLCDLLFDERGYNLWAVDDEARALRCNGGDEAQQFLAFVDGQFVSPQGVEGAETVESFGVMRWSNLTSLFPTACERGNVVNLGSGSIAPTACVVMIAESIGLEDGCFEIAKEEVFGN